VLWYTFFLYENQIELANNTAALTNRTKNGYRKQKKIKKTEKHGLRKYAA